MAVYNYKKFKVSLRHDSKKTQGLQTGDIVRRQYFDGKNLIYSLMCVLDYGTEKVVDADTQEIVDRNYFIGALLEGDAPKQEEILDFARITNLFNEDRSGALYLTATDSNAPFMDVIDNLGRNASLCWPEGVAGEEYQDSTSQYVVENSGNLAITYTPSYQGNSRILQLTCQHEQAGSMLGIKQDFYQYVQNPQAVLVSYKVKANNSSQSYKVRLAYADGSRVDGEQICTATANWQYKFHVITVEWSGRHLRSVQIGCDNMKNNEQLCIADFNIILLSSITNFFDASQLRIGKLNGIIDPVFGQLDKYGGYFQKLYATHAAHISGTLTAGDENGFASTFYAGRIHRNAFLNSLDVDFTSNIAINRTLTNPTGLGNVYELSDNIMSFTAQNNAWLQQKIGKRYCFSAWIYAKQPCQLSVLQGETVIGTIFITINQTHQWIRKSIAWDILAPLADTDDLVITLAPQWGDAVESTVGTEQDSETFFLTAPQLELGSDVTQYQPTDEILTITEDFGAWFNRGGIGGTIQNPLLKLNMDGNGSIGTRTDSFILRIDGSGHLAKGNISWDENGKVTFTDQVTLSWVNLDSTAQNNVISKSVKITGGDTFTMMGDESSAAMSFYPSSIVLTATEENFATSSSQRQWYYLSDGEFKKIQRSNAKTLTILPDSNLWGENESQLTVKYEAVVNGVTYADTFTIRKQHIVGYEVKVVSEKGTSFKNGECATTLTGNVYYQGKLVADSFIADNFTFVWKKYKLPDTDNEIQGWWNEVKDANGNIVQAAIDRTAKTITLNCEIKGQDLYICELQNGNSIFPYTFPIIFA